MGTHESQSLLWERMVLQSKAFWDYAAPLFHEAFPHTKEASPEDFYRAINRVQPGLIRVEADELSYPFHVFLRYDVKGLCLRASSTWRPSRAVELVHEGTPRRRRARRRERRFTRYYWSFGAVGYFPSYARRHHTARDPPRPGTRQTRGRSAAASSRRSASGSHRDPRGREHLRSPQNAARSRATASTRRRSHDSDGEVRELYGL